jgi:peptide/nickel transport system permease protein
MSERPSLLVVLAAILLCGVGAGALCADLCAWLLSVSFDDVNVHHRFADADGRHWLGTDALGRDLFTRLLAGGRTSLATALSAAAAAGIVGVAVGALAALCKGVVDSFLMRMVDALLALPTLPLVLVLAALDVGQSPSATTTTMRVVLLLSVLSWPALARLVRALALRTLTLDHVQAARALGASEMRIVVVHVLPSCLPAVIVQVTLLAGENLLAEGALSFLGLGVPPPLPSWGNMMMGALDLIEQDAPTVLAPALLLSLTAAAMQVAGDHARARFTHGGGLFFRERP